MLILACPGPVSDIPLASLIEQRTLWIWTRKLAILIFTRRSRCHFGPPLDGFRPKEVVVQKFLQKTDSTDLMLMIITSMAQYLQEVKVIFFAGTLFL